MIVTFHSKMNDGDDDNEFGSGNLPSPSADEAFGSSMNDFNQDDDSDVPF